MTAEAALITRFYTAFQQGDWATMAACYHPEAHFSDPAFDLRGKQPAAMWRMLIEGATALEIRFNHVQGDRGEGSASWEAIYPFSQTGRTVHNRIQARFSFRDGLILRHEDQFDFWAWSRMALGAPGYLLGWSPLLRNKVRKMAAQRLGRFTEKHPEYR
ncbi:nuclear transport factor 2 family protein [Chitinimonas sp. BJYL2]|uniref:nuclear transport factor 2 family protein n=1 Tax=Chitinimonas sp. BJYL2 TaxID=2976696 RepID=UPI0022B51F1C|nr:nuclear transport factor 2 family protein [Chitinimonas sp. BJYL2]